MSTTPESEATRDAVRQRYAGIARVTMAETTEPTVEHTYDKEGDKFVRLAVEDNLGAISEPATIKFVVHPVPDLAASAPTTTSPPCARVLRRVSRQPRRMPTQRANPRSRTPGKKLRDGRRGPDLEGGA